MIINFKFYLLSAVFLIVFSFINGSVHAQTAQQAQWWYCLKGAPHGYWNSSITGDGLPTNTDIYVTDCRLKSPEAGGGYDCTTGNKSYDTMLGLEGTFQSYVKIAPSNPIQTTTGSITANDHDTSAADGYNKQFGFFGIVLVQDNAPPITPAISAYFRGTQQQAEINFATPTDAATQNVSNCATVTWDPFGRVFDSKSLEPLPNTKLTVLDSNKKQLIAPYVRNPFTTLVDGVFNFMVQPGIYYIDVLPPQGYAFTGNPNLNPNYASFYKDLYTPESPIQEIAGQAQHRDIPLDPGNNPPYESCPANVAYGTSQINSNMLFTGRFSLPLTKITIEQGNNVLLSQLTDNNGAYNLAINSNKIDPSKSITIAYSKTDLTGEGKVFPKCDSSFDVEPILSYVEGYAYDTNGTIMPNAKVSINLDSTKMNTYTAIADANGFFKINSQYLPIFAYHIGFSNLTNQSTVVMGTSDFVSRNKNYLDNNNINLNTYVNDGPSTKPTPNLENTNNQSMSDNQITNKQSNSMPISTNYNFIITVIIIIILFIGVVGVILFFFINNKKF